jgi:hypothetical protein
LPPSTTEASGALALNHFPLPPEMAEGAPVVFAMVVQEDELPGPPDHDLLLAQQPQAPLLDGVDSPALSFGRQLEELEKRLEELETARQAHEDATRTIIRQTFSEQGSGINDYVTLGGTIEGLVFWAEDFEGVSESDIVLDTAEIDFEIQVNDWTIASLVFEYDSGEDFLFPTTEGDEEFIDRVNVRQAWVMIGNPLRCPPYMVVGRDVIPFGISTGDPVTDVLSIIDPLTVEVFEMEEDFILFGVAWPTPPPPPQTDVAAVDRPGAFGGAPSGSGTGTADTTPAYNPPPVEPVLFAPIAQALGARLCDYCGCYPPRPPPPWTPWQVDPHFNAAIFLFNGETLEDVDDENHIEQLGSTLGYRARGCVGEVPVSIDCDVDFNSSVFDSNFLSFEYRRFLDQIGFIPGMAAHVKSSIGPVALIVEWNAALDDATFVDEAIDPILGLVPGNNVRIRPSAWQVNVAYQFAYVPWLEIIGTEGTYIVIG